MISEMERKESSTTMDYDEEEDLEKLQAEIARMEAEAARIAAETEDLDSKSSSGAKASKDSGATSSTKALTADEKIKRDGHSIYVGQVDYSTTPEELVVHFESCGTIERVTIVCDKFTGKPKGFAYLEFADDDAVTNAIKLDGSTFKDRQLKVTPKRINDPNFYTSQQQQQGNGGGGYQGRGGGRGGRGGGGGRGDYNHANGMIINKSISEAFTNLVKNLKSQRPSIFTK